MQPQGPNHPTPYYGSYPTQPPPKKGIPSWVWIVGCIGCGGPLLIVPILAAILLPVFVQARNKARETSCLRNEKQMALGVLMYAQDYDQALPKANEWMTGTMPYIKNDAAYHCPSVPDKSPAVYGYAFNQSLSRLSLADVSDPANTLAIFDSTKTVLNATDPGTSFPNPARHGHYNVIALLNGAVKLFPAGGSQDNTPGGQ